MLAPGASLTRTVAITPERTVSFLGEALRVYATSQMVYDVEMTARELVLADCPPGEDSVGTGIALSHEGSALVGSVVTIEVTVTAVDRRRVTLRCVVRDQLEVISRGEHSRFVIDVARARDRLAAKRDRLAE